MNSETQTKTNPPKTQAKLKQQQQQKPQKGLKLKVNFPTARVKMVEAESRWLNLGFWHYSRLLLSQDCETSAITLFHVFAYFALYTHKCTSEFQTE